LGIVLSLPLSNWKNREKVKEEINGGVRARAMRISRVRYLK
jgi:hypothetical protein